MSQLIETEAFVHVISEGSFAAAGERLGISSSYASKLVSRLEQRLGVVLLHRTTRKLTLTEAGEIYHQACVEGLGLISQAQTDAHALQVAPRGRLRITLPTNLGLVWLAPWLAEFALGHPALTLDVVYLDRAVDLVGEGFDAAVRVGKLPDSSLIARRLAMSSRVVVASPSYLARAGTPSEPEQLREHACLLYSNSSKPGRWSLSAGAEQRTIDVSGPMLANSGMALLQATIGGLGIAYLPDFHIASSLAAGEIVRVLPQWSSSAPLHALYPSGRHVPVKVRAFVDGLAKHLEEPPWTRLAPAPTRSRARKSKP